MLYLATFTIATLTSILYFSIFWLVSVKFKKAWMADIAWATGFFVVYLVTYLINKSGGIIQNLILLMLLFWGFRLATYLTIRNFNKEDFRYQKLKEKWGSRWLKKSFLNIFIAQAIILVVINSSAIISTVSGQKPQIGLIDYVAALIWLVGFLTESIADLQMFKFKSNPLNHGKILNKGLWSYTRHPNYLGESLMWFAIFLIVLPFPYGIVGIISPIAITFFLLKVTGINTVESKLKDNPEYVEYIKNTPSFIPNLRIKSSIKKIMKRQI